MSQNTFRNQNIQNTSVSDRFLKVRCRKNAHHRSTTSKSIQKWSGVGAFNILTSKCISYHNGVHFFRHRNFHKNGPDLACFVHFDLEMCFAPQCRALFRHLNSQKWPEREVLLAFHLQMCFVPQRRAIFHLSSGQLAPHPPL